MAVKERKDIAIDNGIVLQLDNGDFEKLQETIAKWHFKDYQSFLRFAVSIFLLSQDRSVTVLHDGIEKKYTPADDLVEAVKK